ncbi:MAG TPA: hypothetical protein VFW96_07035 [Thermomicrobiales bacterium]|nr:hypothetical protein [Thermomicrobiales bacterium]
MSWPSDTLSGIFLFLFAFGFIFSVVSLFLGAVGHDLHLPGGEHVGHAAHGGHFEHVGDLHAHDAHGAHAAHAAEPAHGGQGPQGAPGEVAHAATPAPPSPLNISTVMMFITWFGAAGYILRRYYGSSAALSLLAALALGLTGAALVYLFLARVLWRGQTELDPLNYTVAGTLARVSSPIRAGGTGEIVYTLDGKSMVDGARSVDGQPLVLGQEVVIRRVEGGLAYVEPWAPARVEDPFIGDPIEPLAKPPPERH